MKVGLFAITVCALMVGWAVAADSDTMQGTWKRVLGLRDGKPMTGAELEARITVDGDRYTLVEGGNTTSGTFKLDEAAKPKTIDLTPDSGPDQGKTMLGIYEIRAGNRHRLCLAAPGAPRPTKFESRAGSGHIFEEMERVKQ